MDPGWGLPRISIPKLFGKRIADDFVPFLVGAGGLFNIIFVSIFQCGGARTCVVSLGVCVWERLLSPLVRTGGPKALARTARLVRNI